MVVNTMFIYHFVDPDLGVKIFFEERKMGQQNEGVLLLK